jgi:hypothetical protein
MAGPGQEQSLAKSGFLVGWRSNDGIRSTRRLFRPMLRNLKNPTKVVTPVVPLEIWRRGNPDPSAITDDLLLARLAETAAWCDSLGQSESFRTKALSPSLFHDGFDDLVCGVGSARQSQLRSRNLPVQHEAPLIVRGRFMVYFPDENLCDGYAELVSEGFFDVDNVPAHDTWVSFFDEERLSRSSRRHLLCYVPLAATKAANDGIDGNPEQCIDWLDQADVSVRQRVERLVRRA